MYGGYDLVVPVTLKIKPMMVNGLVVLNRAYAYMLNMVESSTETMNVVNYIMNNICT